jgi:Domain of Unknown Function (DUF748)
MKIGKIRVRKGLLITLGAILIALLLVIIIISPLTKYLLEKHDVKLIGREVKIGWVYLNPITGYVHLSDVKIYEKQGDSIFLSVEGASANFALYKLFNKTVEITQLTIDRPWGKIVQKKDTLNFDDIIEKFTPEKSDTTTSPWHVTLLGTKIVDGEFHYYEQVIPINYFIKKVNIEGPGKERNVDTLSVKFSFEDGKGNGSMKGDFTVNMKNLDYRFGVAVDNFDLEIIRQYIWELINYGMFRARLDATIRATGNFNSQDSISASGRLFLRDFHLGKTNEDDYVAFKRLALVIDELSPVRKKYLFDSITLSSPYVKYEIFDSLDNVQALFGKKGKNISDITQQSGRFNLVIEIARYIKVLARNFFTSDFQIGTLGIFNGSFTFNDYSISEKFSMRASPLTILADSVSNKQKRVGITLKSDIKPFGDARFFISINPKDSGDFDMKYSIEKIPAAIFNPYLISVTSFPLDRGTLELNGLWNVRNGEIKSSNHVVILDPRVTKRIRNKDTKWIPLPLIMSLARDRGNVIDYEIPITGNLKDPKFHLHDVLIDVIKNIFVKPPTTPYRMEVKNVETEIEKSLTLAWEMNQRKLSPHQEKFVDKISDFLKDHPEASLAVHPFEYELKEKEHILFFEAKKKYFLLMNHKNATDFNEEDSLQVSKMSAKDHALVKYISKNLSDTVMFTLQEKCVNFVGNQVVNDSFRKLVQARKNAFSDPFVKTGTSDRVKISASESSIPHDGFSYFKFDYPNGAPEELRQAYQKMRELNSEAPRKKYLKERKKTSKTVGR